MSEKWTRNELGFITNGIEHFHQRRIEGIGKIGDDSIAIYFFARCMTVKWSDTKDRDSMFDWLKNAIEDHHKESINYSKADDVRRMASLEIQNRLAGHLVGGGCSHD